jgi:hypothetical protein
MLNAKRALGRVFFNPRLFLALIGQGKASAIDL